MKYQDERQYNRHQADGMRLYHEGAGHEAERQFLAALHDARHSGIPDERLALTLYQLAKLAQADGRFRDAEKYFEESLATEVHGLGPDHPYVAVVLRAFAALLQREGRANEATCLIARADDIWDGIAASQASATAFSA